MGATIRSDAGIASGALLRLGRDPIADLNDDTDANARLVRDRLPAVRDRLLRTYPWNFAMRFAALPGRKLEAPVFGMRYLCPLPQGGDLGECLRLWRVDTREHYEVRGLDLYTVAAPPVTISYVKREDNPERFDPAFAELLIVELALVLINRIPTNEVRKRGQELRIEHKQIKRDARFADAMERAPEKIGSHEGASWLTAFRPL